MATPYTERIDLTRPPIVTNTLCAVYPQTLKLIHCKHSTNLRYICC